MGVGGTTTLMNWEQDIHLDTQHVTEFSHVVRARLMLVVPPAPYRLWGHVDLSSQLALAHARLEQCAEIRLIVHIAVIGEISSIHERKQDLVLVSKPNNTLVVGRQRIV